MAEPDCTSIKKLGLAMHPKMDRAKSAYVAISDAAAKFGIELTTIADLEGATCQALASIGGDGTLLSAIRRVYHLDIPVWGINVGHLGFLTTSGLDEIESGMKRLAEGNYSIEYRAMLEAEVIDEDGSFRKLVALNDIVVHREVPGGGILTIDAELDGHFLATYVGDGLIISTPTGSTGYSLSAGGSILSPALRAFILTTICSHSLTGRSLVLDDSHTLVIRPRLETEEEFAFATADGQEVARLVAFPSDSKDNDFQIAAVTIRRAKQDAGLIRFDDVFFSDVLRDKLGWAEETPLKKTQPQDDAG